MNKRNLFTNKTFKVNKSKRKQGKPRTHAELIARMREPVIVPKVVREKLQCEYLDFKRDRCKNDAEVFILSSKLKSIKLCRRHYTNDDKIMGIIDKLGRISKADRLPDDSPKIKTKVRNEIAKVVEDRSDYFLSELELEAIKTSIIKDME